MKIANEVLLKNKVFTLRLVTIKDTGFTKIYLQSNLQKSTRHQMENYCMSRWMCYFYPVLPLLEFLYTSPKQLMHLGRDTFPMYD